MIRGIDRILLRVSALPAAVRHYRDVLGLKLEREEKRIAVFSLSKCETQLVLHDDPDLPADATYFLVDDVRELYADRKKLNITFVSAPAAVSRGYRATIRDAFGVVMLIIDRTTSENEVEDARPAAGLFPGVTPRAAVRRSALVEIYRDIGRTADDLPYTPHFESLFERYTAPLSEPKPDRAEVWRHLLTTRKAGKLPRLGEAASSPPALSADEKNQLRSILGKDIGKRDRLPYSQRFEEIAEKFNRGRRRPLAAHQLWRAVASLSK
jgi:catechol 2,3-dioxygenase-like lactoylglutathione lyase family enzyme